LKSTKLNVVDHNRDSAGLHYVYPVVSRRAGGVSVGINLNTNQACNWRCIYCQVPNLTLGTAPPVDMALLENELRSFLHELLQGEYMIQRVPEGSRRINDIALSGDGEPTSAHEFLQVVALIGKIKQDLMLPAHIKSILITNGSLLHRQNVQQGLQQLSQHNGEVWFKVDRASSAGMESVNNTQNNMKKVRKNLATSIGLCPTWLQTCWFALDGMAPNKQDEDDYLQFVAGLIQENIRPQGVLLYSIARPSHQPEAIRLSALTTQQLELFADRIRSLGIVVKVSV
jgi:wyosine [tRNA(Phe)-imidazoG37] synthetase (radical SAM superfamily)